ncbi:MAG TPA: GAP family protein [Gaiellaceae bacterium]|nr:GAP family protein [Gaiellaceae bacterium]
MGQAVGSVLPLAAAVAIFPVPIMAVVLIVATERGTVKGIAFVLAWIVGLAAVGAIALALGGAVDASDGGKPATWISVLLLCLGVLLLCLGAKQWQARPAAGEETAMPSWMRAMDSFTTAKAAGAGFALTALNPKNALLTLAAAAEIAEVGLPAGQQIVVLAGFMLVASAGVLSPVVVSLALGDRSRDMLANLRGRLARHNAVIMTVLFVLIGAKLIGDAVAGLSA